MTIKVSDHEFFKRENKDILSTVNMTLSEALLGCKMTVATVHGSVNINTEAGVSSDDQMVLKHWGVPEFNPPDDSIYDLE